MEPQTQKKIPTLPDLLASNDPDTLLGVFQFTPDEGVERIVLKFNLWGRRLFPRFFASEDAPFHPLIDTYNAKVFLGEIDTFTDAAFRGAAKTTRTKLFFTFWLANDKTTSRRYLKILAEDGNNSKQSVTDIYNLLIDPNMVRLYPQIFVRTEHKREETMSSFTTSTGIKLLADTVGSDQRGQIQDDARPDVVWFDDFETRNTLRSPVKTKAIWDNMDEAKTGLAKGGGCIYTANYLSERGNVHKLVLKVGPRDIVLIQSIRARDGSPAWPARYSLAEVQNILDKAENPEEYTQKPSASKDVLYDRDKLDAMPRLTPVRDIAGFKIFKVYDPSHRYASGHDVAGGVGLDSSTSVFIDFDTIPAQVVATYHNNEILPDEFGSEVAKEGDRYGECLVAVERNNHGHATIGRLKQLYPHDRIAKPQRKETKPDGAPKPVEYGWETNGLTKSKMFAAFAKAVENGWVALNDPDLIAEARSYTRNDLMDAEVDPRLTTRHFDLLTAACIAWQHKDFATVSSKKDEPQEEFEEEKPRFAAIGI